MRIVSPVIKTLLNMTLAFVLILGSQAMAVGIDSLSSSDTASGLKEALTRGAEIAVGQLGKKDGFLGN